MLKEFPSFLVQKLLLRGNQILQTEISSRYGYRQFSCNKSEVLNRLKKYEWSTRNTASRPSRLWDLAPYGGHRRPAEPACEHTGRGRELEPFQANCSKGA